MINLLSANTTKQTNTLKQFVGKLPTTYLTVFDYFEGLALKGLIILVSREAFISHASSLTYVVYDAGQKIYK